MNCSQCQDNLEAFLSGQCEPPLRRAIESHIRQCAACAKALAAERQLWELLGQAKTVRPSHGFSERVLRELDSRPRAGKGWLRWPVSLRWGAALVALVAVAMMSFVVFQQKQRPGDTIPEAKVEHFEEFLELVQNVDVESVLNAPLAENGDML